MLLQKQIYAPEINVPSLTGLVLKPLVDGAKFIKMKTCTKCKVEKDESSFSKSKSRKSGLYPSCKSCHNAFVRKYYSENRIRLCLNNNERRKQYPEKRKKQAKEYYLKNKERILFKEKEERKSNPEIGRNRAKRYRFKNREIIASRKRMRRKIDPLYKMKCNLQVQTLRAFWRIKKNKPATTKTLLGCDYNMAKIYIENKFKVGMSWNNYGKWEIDHIIPLVSAKKSEDLALLFHYTNLQPLWKLENVLKGHKIIST